MIDSNTQNALVNRAVDAVCEAAGRTTTATTVIRDLLSAGDFVGCGMIATALLQRTRDKELLKRRIQILRVITSRVGKELELGRLGYKLDKELQVYSCVVLEDVEKVEKDAVLEALKVVLDNLDREDVVNALVAALKVSK